MGGTRQTRERGVLVPHLRAWRAYHAVTQEELAERAQVARSTIVRAEESRRINPSSVRKLAEALEMSVQQFLHSKPGDPKGVSAT